MSELDEKLEEVFGLVGTMHLYVKSILAMVRMKALHGVTDPDAFTEEEKNVCFDEISGPADRLMEILLPLIASAMGRTANGVMGISEEEQRRMAPRVAEVIGEVLGVRVELTEEGEGEREEWEQVFLILCGLVLSSRGDQRALRELSEEEQEEVGTWARAGCRMIERVLGKEGREDETKH